MPESELFYCIIHWCLRVDNHYADAHVANLWYYIRQKQSFCRKWTKQPSYAVRFQQVRRRHCIAPSASDNICLLCTQAVGARATQGLGRPTGSRGSGDPGARATHRQPGLGRPTGSRGSGDPQAAGARATQGLGRPTGSRGSGDPQAAGARATHRQPGLGRPTGSRGSGDPQAAGARATHRQPGLGRPRGSGDPQAAGARATHRQQGLERPTGSRGSGDPVTVMSASPCCSAKQPARSTKFSSSLADAHVTRLLRGPIWRPAEETPSLR